MSAIFDKFIEQVLKNEGGYVDNPNDKWGATKYGIAEPVARANGYKGSMINLSKQTAIDIYKKQYFTKACQEIERPAVSFLIFDMNINHGIKNSVKMLQRALNTLGAGLVVDGIAGAKTIKASNDADEHRLTLALTAERLKFYISIKTFNTFGKGWVRRVADNISFIDGI